MKKVAVVLSGCGFKDGAEITESVSTLIALSEAGVTAFCFAPNITFEVAQYLADEASSKITADKIADNSTKRNVLAESARIARGEIKDLRELKAHDFDAVVFPGGFGAAKTLSNWASAGAQAKVHPEVERILREFYGQAKPIGAICIAPTLVAKVLGAEAITLTIGNDAETATEIEKTGAHHVKCPVTDYISDRDHKVLTTPAYMYGQAKPHEVFSGVRAMIRELVEMS